MSASLLSEYNFHLPEGLIAQYPLEKRDSSRLLVYNQGKIVHETFRNLPGYLPPDSILFFNNTRVIPARLYFKRETGSVIEILLLNPQLPSSNLSEALDNRKTVTWSAIIGNKKKWKSEKLVLGLDMSGKGILLEARLIDRENNLVELAWNGGLTFSEVLEMAGKVPLPPYIHREAESMDKVVYQTIFAKAEGAVAAPTAGLHFTENVLNDLAANGIRTDYLTLHVGAGTFQPVKVEDAKDHPMHGEQIIATRGNILNILTAGKHIAVGTTSMRTLESLYWFGVLLEDNPSANCFIPKLYPYSTSLPDLTLEKSMANIIGYLDRNDLTQVLGNTEILIYPEYKFRVCNGLVTNFHLPGTTLILLVAAFAGKNWREIYRQAIDGKYRFLSFGDSSLIIP